MKTRFDDAFWASEGKSAMSERRKVPDAWIVPLHTSQLSTLCLVVLVHFTGSLFLETLLEFKFLFFPQLLEFLYLLLREKRFDPFVRRSHYLLKLLKHFLAG